MSSTGPGKSHPLGATINPGGVNFSIYSKHGSAAELLLFGDVYAQNPSHVFRLTPSENRTGHYWHIFVPGIQPGQLYAWRMDGPHQPGLGLLYDFEKVLLDPYGRGVATGANYDRLAASQPGDNASSCMKSVVVDPRAYDWEGDRPLKRATAKSVLYEMHVSGFTSHPNSGVVPEKRGTYAGFIEKIPYLKELGVTAVELLPVYQFDAMDAPPGRKNYWGYSPVSFFAPHDAYSSRKDPLGPVDEFRDMVKSLHRAGIEVILDVVYNHTAEGGADGPVLSLRGLENPTYYILEPGGQYANFSGCGNTLNANHSIVRRLIMDSLHHWVQLMHVDGFRFDLASILARDEAGNPLKNPPLLWEIESDPVLAGTKLIAEAWDAAGLYQVGSFVGDFWLEWNGRFRDDVRGFWKGDPSKVRSISERLWASPDIYGYENREPEQSVNFVTCHDGFTLNDLVSYNIKHNQQNGEKNQDGNDFNLSWNCGVEGPSEFPQVERLRSRQVKNFIATTLLSLGTPMLLMGDEVRRTQRGNNNAYAQDNETSWFDWSLLQKYPDILRFTRLLIAFRLRLPFTRRSNLETPLNELLRESSINWHGTQLDKPDWAEQSHSIAFTARSMSQKRFVHVILNAYWEPLQFELPVLSDHLETGWWRLVDTGLDAPHDISELDEAPRVHSISYLAQPRSMVLLASDRISQT